MTSHRVIAVIHLGLAFLLSAVAHADVAPNATREYSAAALYNQGNAYARTGQPALAILLYERASLLAPNDPDIAANLRYERNLVHQPMPASSALVRTATAVSPTAAAWIGVAGLLTLGLCTLAEVASSGQRRWHRAGMLVGAAALGLTITQAAILWPALHSGVVLTAATPVRATPVPMGEPLFALPAAETVTIRAAHDEFLLIRTQTGKTGWVERANVAPIVPGG